MERAAIPDGAQLALVRCRECGSKFVAVLPLRAGASLQDRIVPCHRPECRIGNLIREDAEAYAVPATGGAVAIIDAQDAGFEGVVASQGEALDLLTEIANRWNAGRASREE